MDAFINLFTNGAWIDYDDDDDDDGGDYVLLQG
jgi:hypothetical protein